MRIFSLYRQKLRPRWEKAVKFIEANESRIRIENQSVQGEEFLVWRWLPVSHSSSLYFCSEKKERLAVVYSLSEILLYNFSLQACSNGGKFWQGQGMYCIGFILCMLGKMENFLFVFDYCIQFNIKHNCLCSLIIE